MDNPFTKYKHLLQSYIDQRSIPVLWKHWNNRDRGYHNIEHLKKVIAYIEKWYYRFTRDEFDQLILAAFFHDVIYDTRNPDNNEEESKKFFRKAYIGKDKKFELVDRAIDVTKERKKPTAFPLRIFWEADNQIFKGTWKEYLAWEKGIRKEYSHVSDDIYKKARIDFLESNLGVFGPKSDSYIRKLVKHISDK